MITYLQAKSYLGSLIDYEKKISFVYKQSIKLQRMHRLLEAAKIPYRRLRFIHIAGTKGKGSTAQFCAYVLAALGFRVGLYTSPHFFDFRERIAIVSNGREFKYRLIPRSAVADLVSQMAPSIERSRKSAKNGNLSFFEAYTALAFKYFCQMRPGYVVLEAGLGGRLDATNVVVPRVSIITHIGYDHTDKLGSRLSQIAGEKAGIIKPGIPVVVASQRPEVLRVIQEACRKRGAALFINGKDFATSNVSLKKGYTVFDFHMGSVFFPKLKIALRGLHQVENASLVLAAVNLLKEKNFSLSYIKKALFEAKLSGRFETLLALPLTIVDIAHNPSAFSVLQESLRVYYPDKKIILIFGASQDKDIKKMLAALDYARIILTKFNNPRSFEPLRIKQICGLRYPHITSNIKEAFQIAQSFYTPDSLILIAGSFFLVSEAKQMLATNHRKQFSR